MKTTARKMSIFVFMVVMTTTTLALGTSTAMAASNIHTHHHNTHLLSNYNMQTILLVIMALIAYWQIVNLNTEILIV